MNFNLRACARIKGSRCLSMDTRVQCEYKHKCFSFQTKKKELKSPFLNLKSEKMKNSSFGIIKR